MENPCRELRQLLGLNQVEFCRLIGKSYQSLKVYEKHPEDTPAAVVEQLKTLAVARGHAEWAANLAGEDWRVVSVLKPGETLISAASTKKPMPTAPSDRAQLHRMLDDILDSGDPDAIRAVVPNLELFHKWVIQQRPAAAPTVRKKKA